MWIAPNLVTLLGFFFILGNIAILEIYVPDLVGPVSIPSWMSQGMGTDKRICEAPSWVYFSFAFGMWM
jgi:ethanolaminephosphotransferase